MTMIRVLHPPGYEAERRYAYDVVLREFLGLPYRLDAHEGGDVHMTLDDDPSGAVLTLPDRLFQTPPDRWLRGGSLPKTPLPTHCVPTTLGPVRVLDKTLPVVYGRPDSQHAVFGETSEGASLSIDVFGSAFFLLTRYEEIALPHRDEHSRFPDTAMLASRAGFLERPLVNEYVEVLWAAMQRLWPGLQRRPRAYRPLVTHDVDWPFCTAGRNWLQVAKRATADVLRYGDGHLARARLQSYRRTRRGSPDPDLWNTFDQIMDVDERNGVRGTFYFIGERTAGNLDGTYDIGDRWIRRLLRRIHDRGHEIGLHTSYHSSSDATRIPCELAALQQACREEGIEQERWGGRQHWLRWQNPVTWRYYEQTGLEHDSSLGCSHHAGFRASVCYEYPVFDLRARTPLRLRERPLVAMEIAAFRGDGYEMEAVCERLIRLNRVTRSFDGDFVLLWHNNSLVSDSQRLCFRTVVNAASGCRDGW